MSAPKRKPRYSYPREPQLILSALDPAAPFALNAYASELERLKHPHFAKSMRRLAIEFEEFRIAHLKDSPEIFQGIQTDDQDDPPDQP